MANIVAICEAFGTSNQYLAQLHTARLQLQYSIPTEEFAKLTQWCKACGGLRTKRGTQVSEPVTPSFLVESDKDEQAKPSRKRKRHITAGSIKQTKQTACSICTVPFRTSNKEARAFPPAREVRATRSRTRSESGIDPTKPLREIVYTRRIAPLPTAAAIQPQATTSDAIPAQPEEANDSDVVVPDESSEWSQAQAWEPLTDAEILALCNSIEEEPAQPSLTPPKAIRPRDMHDILTTCPQLPSYPPPSYKHKSPPRQGKAKAKKRGKTGLAQLLAAHKEQDGGGASGSGSWGLE
jgi:hypothetical protein